MTRAFHIGDILSVTTGCLVSPTRMAGLNAILEFLVGDEVYTNQIPRVCDECRPWLLEQYPELATADASGVDESNHRDWLARQTAIWGETLEVEPLPPGRHEAIDPVDEAIRMIRERPEI